MNFRNPPTKLARHGKDEPIPADDIIWGVVVRDGFDELDDPTWLRGSTQHAYLEGDDRTSLCGFKPPLSGRGPSRRPRLALPSVGNPMCGACARHVGPPRQRVAVPIVAQRTAVPLRVVTEQAPAFSVEPPRPVTAIAVAPVEPTARPATHLGGLLDRGVHTDR